MLDSSIIYTGVTASVTKFPESTFRFKDGIGIQVCGLIHTKMTLQSKMIIAKLRPDASKPCPSNVDQHFLC